LSESTTSLHFLIAEEISRFQATPPSSSIFPSYSTGGKIKGTAVDALRPIIRVSIESFSSNEIMSPD
jgi:hypothetical protein